MNLQWKEFKINLMEFKKFLDENISGSDGIVAGPEGFMLVSAIPFTEEQITLIQNYYNSLQPESDNGEN